MDSSNKPVDDKDLTSYIKKALQNINTSSDDSKCTENEANSSKKMPYQNMATNIGKQFSEHNLNEEQLKQSVEDDLRKIQNQSLKDDNKLRKRFAYFIGFFLTAQACVVFTFLFQHYDIFEAKHLKYIILTILGQSYFLPGFLAKYLFQNSK